MQLDKVLEQHIAVFGGSGSGKTVSVSSFYGATQEPDFVKSSLFDVTADDTGQGHRLHRNYLGMRDSARVPEPTKFAPSSYAFTMKLKNKYAKENGQKAFDAVRLVWHDYPGEWFEEEVSGPAEAERRVATFKALLGSDVALLLVDGQRVLDNAGEETRYLRSLFGSFRTGLLRLEDQLLEDGKPLVRFPRIWVLALSKADLLPHLDVFRFRDLIVEAAADDLAELRTTLAGFVESPEALSVGEDFILLSSARFEPDKIEVTERIGLDLMLPLAAILPLERHLKWAQKKQMAAKVSETLLSGVATVSKALMGKKPKAKGVKDMVLGILGKGGIAGVLEVGVDQLRAMHESALAKHDYLAAVLTQFRLDLDEAEDTHVLLRSKK